MLVNLTYKLLSCSLQWITMSGSKGAFWASARGRRDGDFVLEGYMQLAMLNMTCTIKNSQAQCRAMSLIQPLIDMSHTNERTMRSGILQ